jgi:hypothetical protein
MRCSALARVGLVGGAPTFDPLVVAGSFQSGDFIAAITDGGVGNVTPNMHAERGIELAQSIELAQYNGALAGSDLVSIGVLPAAGDILKACTIVQETGGGGATARTDLNFALAMLSMEEDKGEYAILGAGVIQPTGAGAVAFTWQDGGWSATVTYTGAGDWTITRLVDRGELATDCALFLTPRGTLVASGMVGTGVTHTSATAKRVRCVQEQAAGAASILADPVDAAGAMGIDFLLLGKTGRSAQQLHHGMTRGAKYAAACAVTGTTGAIVSSSSRILSVARAGLGLWDITTTVDGGVAAADAACIVTARSAMAAHLATNFSVAHTSATVKRVTCMQETGAGGGAASAAADCDFSFFMAERVP